jgi:hypothetical protein
MCRDPLDDIAQIGEGVEVQVLAGLYEGTQDRGSVRGGFAAAAPCDR